MGDFLTSRQQTASSMLWTTAHGTAAQTTGCTSCCNSAVDTCKTFTVIQLLLLQQPSPDGDTRLTCPVQEHFCHPMPPAPNSTSTSTEQVTMICDSLFIAPITLTLP
ncbi:MAG: hypothetical protein IK126_00520 [Bacteroidales bacterium]|nr:hypothetical protein [Bacteroidales bacterium]